MSVTVLVVADDFTGANAVAANFVHAGFSAVTVGKNGQAADLASLATRFDALALSTDTRHSAPDETRRRVMELVEAVWPARLVCNRVDSTLRGNIGTSTAAALTAVKKLAGRHAVAICAPSHPVAGRHTVDGLQMVYGKRLETTELAHDPLNPVTTSDVATLLSAGTNLRVGKVPLRIVTGAGTELVAAIRSALPEIDALVVDTVDLEHVDAVARAAVEASGDILLLGVDPGPASVALARALGLAGRASIPLAVLVVSGSTTELTRRQLRCLALRRSVRKVPVALCADTGRLDVRQTSRALERELKDAAPGEVVVLATALDDADVISLDAVASAQLSRDLARVAHESLCTQPVAGVFCSGGDVAAALVAELGASGLAAEREVVSLAVAGVLIGGRWDGLPVVTKGGFVGGPDTIVACVDFLKQRAMLTGQHPVGAASDFLGPVDP